MVTAKVRKTAPAEASTTAHSWEILVEAGVPLGPPHARSGAPSALELAAAMRAVVDGSRALSGLESEALYATLRAWQSHWPTSFTRELGEHGPLLLARLLPAAGDRSRYLKLRRIALSHLSRML